MFNALVGHSLEPVLITRHSAFLMYDHMSHGLEGSLVYKDIGDSEFRSRVLRNSKRVAETQGHGLRESITRGDLVLAQETRSELPVDYCPSGFDMFARMDL